MLPNPIGTICVILTLWCIVSARSARSAIILNPSATNNFSGNGRPSTGAKGVSKNTQAMLLLGGIYFLISLPNIFLYILISLQVMSCTMTFVALIASDIFSPVSNFTCFTRIFDGLAFLVIPEFRAALINVLHCKFHTKAFWLDFIKFTNEENYINFRYELYFIYRHRLYHTYALTRISHRRSVTHIYFLWGTIIFLWEEAHPASHP